MACRFLYLNKWDSANSCSASSEAPGYPAVNSQHRWHLKTWRSTTANQEQWLGIVSWGLSAKAAVILNNNLNLLSNDKKLRLQASVVGFPQIYFEYLWNSPSYCLVGFFEKKTYDSWRVLVPAGASSNSYFEIGRVFLGDYFEPKRHFMAVNYEYIDPSKIHFSKSGQILTVQETKYKISSYVFQVDSEDKKSFEIMFNNVGLGGNLFFCENTNDPLGSTIYCRLVKFTVNYLFKNLWRIEITLEQLR